MNKELISEKQAICILIMFMLGSTIVLGVGTEAKQDKWISVLLALLMFIPTMLVYIRIANLFPQKNLYEILVGIFGNTIGKIIVSLYVFYAIHLGALIMRNFSEFINIVTLPETPKIVLQIFLLVICVWMVKSGVEALGRWSKFVVPFTILVPIGIFIIGLKDMDFKNLKPIGGAGFENIIQGAFSTFSFPFAESVLLLTLFSSIKKDSKPGKIYINGTIVASLLILSAIIRNISILGMKSYNMFCFPSYSAVGIISLGDFFSRFEVLMGLDFILCGFVKLSVCLFASAIGMANIFNVKDYKTMAYPAGFLIITLSSIIYKSSTEMFSWIKIYRYYAFPFQVILPLIILIGAEIKNFINKI